MARSVTASLLVCLDPATGFLSGFAVTADEEFDVDLQAQCHIHLTPPVPRGHSAGLQKAAGEKTAH